MRAVLRSCLISMMLGAVSLAAQSNPAPAGRSASATKAKPQVRKAARKTRSKPQPLPQPGPPQPIRQMTPEQLPAAPPRVIYRNGLLTIDSRNSTLADILREVRRQTGAQIEMPPATANERVAAQLGPAPARDVIGSLLNGSHFGYLIIGAPENPAAVQRIMLTMLPAGGAAAPPAVTAQNASRQPSPEPDEEEPDVDRNPPPQPEIAAPGAGGVPPVQYQPGQPGQPPVPPNQPGFQPGAVQQVNPLSGMQPGQQVPPGQPPFQPQQQPGNPNQPPEVKTPDQLLQELQRLRQQQQQLQQQQQQQQQQQPPPQ